jgi:hypothetical protein
MSSESVCQVAYSWLTVGSFHMRLFGDVYVTCGDLDNGPEKGIASVQQILCQSWERCYRDSHTDSTSLRGPNLESYAGVSMARCNCNYLTPHNWFSYILNTYPAKVEHMVSC